MSGTFLDFMLAHQTAAERAATVAAALATRDPCDCDPCCPEHCTCTPTSPTADPEGQL